MRRTHAALIVLAGLLLAPAAFALEVRDARTPEPPGDAPVMAGYMEVHNTGDEAVRIEGASSPAFGRISLHETIVEADTARMQSVEAFEVPANGKISLRPRGKHLMLYDRTHDLKVGDSVPLMLETSAGSVTVTLDVVEGMQHGHGGHDDEHH